jgi:putative oxidoreductase
MGMIANEKIGKLILRLALGVVVLLHGIAKLKGGVGGISDMVAAHGLPAVLGYAVYIGEVVAPVLVILGLYARVGGLLIALNMLVAMYLVHRPDLFTLGPQGGWAIELQVMILASAIGVMLFGPGKAGFNEK